MRKPLPPSSPLRDTHPDKEYFRNLIERETNPEKLKQLKKEEEAHNHPNREKH